MGHPTVSWLGLCSGRLGTRGPVMGTYIKVLGQQRKDSFICEGKLATFKSSGDYKVPPIFLILTCHPSGFLGALNIVFVEAPARTTCNLKFFPVLLHEPTREN